MSPPGVTRRTLSDGGTMSEGELQQRAEQLFEDHRDRVYRRTDRVFAVLMVAQWVFAIVLALVVSPVAWAGRIESVHVHVYAAVFLGGAITSLPLALTLLKPGRPITRYVV